MPPADPLDLAKEILGGHVANGLCPSMNVTRQLLNYVQVARQNRCVVRPEGNVLHGTLVNAAQSKQMARAYLEGRQSLTAAEVCHLAVTVLGLSEALDSFTAVQNPPTAH